MTPPSEEAVRHPPPVYEPEAEFALPPLVDDEETDDEDTAEEVVELTV